MYMTSVSVVIFTIFSFALAGAASVTAADSHFDASSNTNMAVYWGQGPAQKRLAHFCADSNIDIIPIAFLNIFPDQLGGGYPGTNFGNQCGDATYKNEDGSWSPLLSDCPLIGPDIKTCQSMGKKILLSLGGAIPTNQSIPSDDAAVSFANFLWGAFGPTEEKYHGPRPFGDAVVDGFDFDIESSVTGGDPSSLYRGYAKIIQTLRGHFSTSGKDFFISGAPQCVVPDTHLAEPIENAWFDFLFIQFYNTPQCSARSYFNASYGSYDGQPTTISFDKWVNFIRTTALNKDVKLFIGLPAAPLTQLAYETTMYIAPDDVRNLIDLYQCRYPQEFGGIMVFEATYSEQNLIDGEPYVDVLKSLLTKNSCAQKPTTAVSSLPSATSSLSGVSSVPASSSAVSSVILSSAPLSSSGIASASASLPAYQSSTGVWNSSVFPSTFVPVDTASSVVPPYPSSTGLWNSTYVPRPTTPIPSGTGSQISTFPANTSLPISSIASSTGSSYPSSSTEINESTPVSSKPSLTYPTGISSGVSSTIVTSGALYPLSNGTVVYTSTGSNEGYHTTVDFDVTSSYHSKPTTLGTDKSEATATSTEGLVTTVIVTSYTTTCPVTNVVTTSGRQSIQTTFTISTIYSTITSTTCKKCSASATSPPVQPGPLSSGSHPAPGPQQPARGGSTSEESDTETSVIPSNPAGPAHNGFAGSNSAASSGTHSPPVQEGSSNSYPPPAAAASQGQGTTMLTSTKLIIATVFPIPPGGEVGNSPEVVDSYANGVLSSSGPSIVTQTLVPIPVNPSQTAHVVGPSIVFPGSAGSSVPAVPFPTGNGTVPGGSTSIPSASVSGSEGGGQLQSTNVPFTGEGSRIRTGAFGTPAPACDLPYTSFSRLCDLGLLSLPFSGGFSGLKLSRLSFPPGANLFDRWHWWHKWDGFRHDIQGQREPKSMERERQLPTLPPNLQSFTDRQARWQSNPSPPTHRS
ncbi:MAG: hypothetical protein Q9167_003115 [Letrouitia subvulpina]